MEFQETGSQAFTPYCYSRSGSHTLAVSPARASDRRAWLDYCLLGQGGEGAGNMWFIKDSGNGAAPRLANIPLTCRQTQVAVTLGLGLCPSLPVHELRMHHGLLTGSELLGLGTCLSWGQPS